MSSKAKHAEFHGEPFLVSASDSFLESIPDHNTPEALYAEHEEALKSELSRILSKLPEKESEALSLWFSGLTQQSVAERDGVTQAAVSIRAKRGLEKLFAMRDKGEIATLKNIWEGLTKVRRELAGIQDLESAVDSSVDLGFYPEVIDMTPGEISVLDCLNDGPRHLNEIKATVWPNDEKGYSWTRNALRKLVKFDFVKKVGKGRYEQVGDS